MPEPKSILESRSMMAKLDQSNMLGSIEELGRQVEHAWQDLKSVSFKPSAEIRHVVIAGMGGSGLGADVIKHLFKDQLRVPLDYVHDYTLPGYVNQHTLVVLASYSGTTEEILACADHAQELGAQIMVIAAGGPLADLARNKNYAIYLIDAKYNPSNQPRMAIGYAVFGTIGLLAKAGIVSVSDDEVKEVVKTIDQVVKDCTVEVAQENNPAKALAFLMLDRRPVIVAAEFLEGAAHVATNQHNENAKSFVDYKVVPEINHHLMEGLRFPSSNALHHVFIFAQSQLYQPANAIRMQLTQKVVEDNGIETMMTPLRAHSKMAQVFEMIALFSFGGFYLSMLEGIDPTPIPFVDGFKDELKKRASVL
jgi:glucose/mannose-6-phosphate isomerase